MRAVSRLDEIDEAYKRCQSEARASFGNGDVYVEQLMPRARHIEVQIIGDGTGNVSHLWERECSIQRRNQKIVEIAPSPGLAPAMRDRLTAAAVRMAKEVRYDNLGTFEFLVNADASAKNDEAGFAFIEANPRLQVEHTVTEEVTGIDLVKLQIQLACRPLARGTRDATGGYSQAARFRDAGANQHGIDACRRQREAGRRDDHRVRGAIGTARADRFVRLCRIHDQPELRFAARQAHYSLALGGLRRRGDEDLSRAVRIQNRGRADQHWIPAEPVAASGVHRGSGVHPLCRGQYRGAGRRRGVGPSAAVLRLSGSGSQSGHRAGGRASRGGKDRRERSARRSSSRQIGQQRAVTDCRDHHGRDAARSTTSQRRRTQLRSRRRCRARSCPSM